MSSLRSSCEEILRGNDRGGYTVPSPRLYPHQWAWDSAFAAIGWAYVDPPRAWREIEVLMGAQWDDGRVPHIVFHRPSEEYFPGPDFWETERSSSITQPPIWATAARRVVEIAGFTDSLRELIPRFDASHRFFAEQRDPLGFHAVAVSHPWESGLDNSPAWDGPVSRVDVSRPPAFERRDEKVVGDASMRPTDEQYLRYACLVKQIAADGFGPGPFAVYDPMFSAILARGEDDLAWLAAEVGLGAIAAAARERAARVRAGLMEHLWDETLGRFVYYDANAREVIAPDVVGSYVPLWCGMEEAVAGRLRKGLAERFASRWRLPSTSPSDAAFDGRRYWRGPVWVNVNWLLSESIEGLAEHTLELIERSGVWEYYEPTTGEGLGGERFTWTAALALDLLERRAG